MRIVKCPYCGKASKYSPTNPFRPFCSERCQMVDLGKWANEEYAVPSEEAPDLEESESSQDNEDKRNSNPGQEARH